MDAKQALMELKSTWGAKFPTPLFSIEIRQGPGMLHTIAGPLS